METVNAATTVETGEGSKAPDQTMAETQKPFIVGEHSVYPDVASLFEGAKAKENFIQTLQKEKRESEALIQDLQAKVQELTNLKQFKEDLQNMDNLTDTKTTEQTSSLTPEKVQELALAALQQKQESDRLSNNLKEVMDVATKVFGTEAENKIEAKCAELGMTKEAGQEIAKASPKAFLKMLGLDAPVAVSVDDILNKGRTTMPSTGTQAPQVDPLTNILNTPSNGRNQQYIQKLFQDGLKDPNSIIQHYKPWEV